MTLLDIGFESLFISGEHEVQQGMVNTDGTPGSGAVTDVERNGMVGTREGQRHHSDNAE